MHPILMWTIAVVVIGVTIWIAIDFVKWVFNLGREPAVKWDYEHRCHVCGQPTGIMEMNPAIRLCYWQHGYWIISEHGNSWHHIDPTMPTGEFTLSDN